MMSHRRQDTLMMSTVARGGQIKRTYNLAFDQIESESSAKRARLTIPCQAEGSGEDDGTMAEDAAETDIEERKDQFLRTVEKLLKSSVRKRHVIGGEKKKELGWRKNVVDETKWPGTVRCKNDPLPRMRLQKSFEGRSKHQCLAQVQP